MKLDDYRQTYYEFSGKASDVSRLAMIDSGCTNDWRPSLHIKNVMKRSVLDYLMITNADQDHMQDLNGLWKEEISVTNFKRNSSVTPEQLRAIKEEDGRLTDDAERYISSMNEYVHPVVNAFDDSMGGITRTSFCNNYPNFKDTNNLSLVIFIKYGGFKILFPGDMERAGWLALLKDVDFCNELKGTSILVASHHGRENGYCEEIFEYFTPDAIVISDKAIVHDTQDTVGKYRRKIPEKGVTVHSTNKQRHVLTTRRDGWIRFTVNDNGSYYIHTENGGDK